MPYEPGQPVDAQETITHVGICDSKLGKGRLAFRFLCEPRPDDLGALSVYVGRLGVQEAVLLITLGQSPNPRPGDAVRYSRASLLLDQGFSLTHAPDFSDEHVLVKWDGEWDEDVSKRLDRCFEEHVRYVYG